MTSDYTDLALYRRILRHLRPYWLPLAGILLVGLLSSPLALLNPLPLKIAVDNVLGSHPLPGLLASWIHDTASGFATTALVLAAGLVVAIALLTQLQAFASRLLRMYVHERLVLAFRAQLFGHAQRLSLLYHDRMGTSDSIYRIQYDAHAVSSVALDSIFPFITSIVTLLAMLAVAMGIDWQLTLLALTVLPAIILVSHIYRQRLRANSRQVKELESSALAVIQEVLSVLRVVKSFGQEEREQERFVCQTRLGAKARLRLAVAEGMFGILVGLITATGTGAVLFIGVRHIQSGILTLGDLILVMGYLAQVYGPVKTLSTMSAKLQYSLTSAERAFALLDQAPDIVERPNARPLKRATGAVAFRNVSFAYENANTVLHNLSFEVHPGIRVGVIGKTGAGKSTLMNLLIRFYDPTAGEILLDGIDLRDYRLADLRNQFAIVLQEPVLFSTSIAENIAYARPDATHPEIVAAAEAAGAHDFIANLPQGYETQVGERGMCLSGGERQRLSLARAFLRDAPILILDEPTSSVDMGTETAIMTAMERLMRGRTTFMVAHRLSTLRGCDVLLRIDQGRLVEMISGEPEMVYQALAMAEATGFWKRGGSPAGSGAEVILNQIGGQEPGQAESPIHMRRCLP